MSTDKSECPYCKINKSRGYKKYIKYGVPSCYIRFNQNVPEPMLVVQNGISIKTTSYLPMQFKIDLNKGYWDLYFLPRSKKLMLMRRLK